MKYNMKIGRHTNICEIFFHFIMSTTLLKIVEWQEIYYPAVSIIWDEIIELEKFEFNFFFGWVKTA